MAANKGPDWQPTDDKHDGWSTYLSSLPAGSLKNVQVAVFGGCHTADDSSRYGNLLKEATKLGARSAVGFAESPLVAPQGLWGFYFMEGMVAGERRTSGWFGATHSTFEHAPPGVGGDNGYSVGLTGYKSIPTKAKAGWPDHDRFEDSLTWKPDGLQDALAYAAARIDEWDARRGWQSKRDTYRAWSYVGNNVYQNTNKIISKIGTDKSGNRYFYRPILGEGVSRP